MQSHKFWHRLASRRCCNALPIKLLRDMHSVGILIKNHTSLTWSVEPCASACRAWLPLLVSLLLLLLPELLLPELLLLLLLLLLYHCCGRAARHVLGAAPAICCCLCNKEHAQQQD
jgi:hypothetical protein